MSVIPLPLPIRSVAAGNGSAVFSQAADLFQLLRDGEPRTRAELAAITGLARSTIAARVETLLAADLISPVGEAASSGGRPPSRIAFNPAARVVIAADIGASHGVVALTDLAGTVLASTTADLSIADGPETVLAWVAATAGKLLADTAGGAPDVAGIGIGLPGPVEHTTGRPTNPPIMPGWDGFDVPGFLQRSFLVPVLVDNDVNIMALGEQSTQWPGDDNLLFVKVATGIGAGIIGGGQLQRGAVGAAGDLGHVRVPNADHVICRCGNTGCLEALVGGPALAAQMRELGFEARSVRDVVALARGGNGTAIAAVRQAGRDIGTVLATCVNLLNPSTIVIGGALAESGEHLLAGIREVVYQRSLPLSTARLRIVASRAMESAGILGAAMMVVQHVLGAAMIEATLAQATASAQH
ncbi:ROK family transcriptional regulator [Cryobacterium melibiosiphilum]|uniref:ROK family transcriptional regulator n=1 Tax=Cryobacterium melibiosiphilum TaxID=995039 RepID=A0A3A5MKU6_9MICO|nr:ROK family transcriptional regulator [Cryobacterium melibiosiphilum]RJT89665.1 ROK family transcriptional regulator [Cryobacterium melibiosiphilum]